MPPVDSKIGIRRQHHGIVHNLGHLNEAGIREAHWHLGVFLQQPEHRGAIRIIWVLISGTTSGPFPFLLLNSSAVRGFQVGLEAARFFRREIGFVS